MNPEAQALYEDLKARLGNFVPDPELYYKAEIAEEINRLKRQRNAVILGHNYMEPVLFHSIPDFKGDSLDLSRKAAQTDKDVIVFCGVRFMAETAKILNPGKTVLLPADKAGCSLAESITAEDVRALKRKYPGVPVVTYVNTYADVKAESDICCTSGNAVAVVESLHADTIIFLPDQYLASNVARETGKHIIFPTLSPALTPGPSPTGRGEQSASPTGRDGQSPSPTGGGVGVRDSLPVGMEEKSPSPALTPGPSPTGRGEQSVSPTGRDGQSPSPTGRGEQSVSPIGRGEQSPSPAGGGVGVRDSLLDLQFIGWHGRCEVHEKFTVEDIRAVRAQFPDVAVLTHPECSPEVVAEADFSGSTNAMIRFVQESRAPHFLVLTECSMGDNIAAANPQKDLLRLCMVRCPHMNTITLENVRDSLILNRHIIEVPEEIRLRAFRAVQRMIEIG